jgi:hypothetical protein
MSFQAVASVSPVLGGKTSPPFPQVNQLNFEPWLVPYGAREFRVLPYSIGGSGIPVGIYPGAVVQFNHPSIALPAFTALQIPAANCLDWTLIPGQAVSVQTTTESFSTIQFR